LKIAVLAPQLSPHLQNCGRPWFWLG